MLASWASNGTFALMVSYIHPGLFRDNHLFLIGLLQEHSLLRLYVCSYWPPWSKACVGLVESTTVESLREPKSLPILWVHEISWTLRTGNLTPLHYPPLRKRLRFKASINIRSHSYHFSQFLSYMATTTGTRRIILFPIWGRLHIDAYGDVLQVELSLPVYKPGIYWHTGPIAGT